MYPKNDPYSIECGLTLLEMGLALMFNHRQ